jgi:hypothetical protein
MYSIFINLQTCLGKIFDCFFPRKNSESLLQTNHSSDVIEHYMIYKDQTIQD